ncbi:MAG: hypothetical protein WAW07_01605 [Bacteroidales bacterium]
MSQMIKKYIFLLLTLAAPAVHGQILQDTAAIRILKEGVDDIYGFRFSEARQKARKLSEVYPDHPVLYLYNGMVTYWSNHPLTPMSQASDLYEKDMTTCIGLCEKERDQDNYAEYLLANLGARGMLLMYYADNNLQSRINPMVIDTYRYIRESFDYATVYPDFNFFTGLYNYYREAYPEAHPIYKVLAFLFPGGDKVKGIAEMQNAAFNSIMLKAEAWSFLSYIFMSFENNYQLALPYTKGLYELYPANLPYTAGYIKNLLLLKRYSEAEAVMKSLNGSITNGFFQAQMSVFNGILQEKLYRNYDQAEKYYNRGISEFSTYGYYGNDYSSYAYFGLSRISGYRGDKQNKKTFRKMANELSYYRNINFDD